MTWGQFAVCAVFYAVVYGIGFLRGMRVGAEFSEPACPHNGGTRSDVNTGERWCLTCDAQIAKPYDERDQ